MGRRAGAGGQGNSCRGDPCFTGSGLQLAVFPGVSSLCWRPFSRFRLGRLFWQTPALPGLAGGTPSCPPQAYPPSPFEKNPRGGIDLGGPLLVPASHARAACMRPSGGTARQARGPKLGTAPFPNLFALRRGARPRKLDRRGHHRALVPQGPSPVSVTRARRWISSGIRGGAMKGERGGECSTSGTGRARPPKLRGPGGGGKRESVSGFPKDERRLHLHFQGGRMHQGRGADTGAGAHHTQPGRGRGGLRGGRDRKRRRAKGGWEMITGSDCSGNPRHGEPLLQEVC